MIFGLSFDLFAGDGDERKDGGQQASVCGAGPEKGGEEAAASGKKVAWLTEK